MEENDIALKLNDHEHEIGSLKHRVKDIEAKQSEIGSLANSVNELAINMKYMLEEQKEQGNRLKKLETEPADNAKYYKRTIISCIISAVLGGLFSALMAIIEVFDMTLEIILTIVFAVLTIAGTLGSWYFYVKNKINAAIAGEIDSAENNDVDGKQKMAIVVEQLQTIIPAVLKPFFTKQLLESLVQAAFDKIEDYAKKQAGKNTTKGETSDENA